MNASEFLQRKLELLRGDRSLNCENFQNHIIGKEQWQVSFHLGQNQKIEKKLNFLFKSEILTGFAKLVGVHI